MRGLIPSVIVSSVFAGPQTPSAQEVHVEEAVTAREMREQWILDGKGSLHAVTKNELRLSTPAKGQLTLWRPVVYAGPMEIAFDCQVLDDPTKLLLLVYGHGTDGTPIWGWQRTGSYDEYNSGPMEVYTLAFNRGPHTATRVGDEFANIRRIGSSAFEFYGKDKRSGLARDAAEKLWLRWNTLSFIGGAREPVSGQGKYLSYRAVFDPPHIRLEVDGVAFCEVVDHRASPLTTGSIAFRCMSPSKTFLLRNVRIQGTAVASRLQ